MSNKNHAFGLYIHWPYCLNKCPYCDFASKVIPLIDEEMLLKGYLRDILFFKEKFGPIPSVSSVFFGGGTPSLMSEKMFDSLLTLLNKHFCIQKEAEISLEANPDTINLKKMASFKQSGLNRLSIGVQSLNEKDLKLLGRIHSVQTALMRIEEAQKIFDKVSIDLIYARYKQSLKSWEKELQFALSLGLTHYSLYQLTIEEGTAFYKNNIPQISELQAKRLYQLTEDIMTHNGILPYEISNYAKKGFECRHNLLYWHAKDYLGIGPAAHGRINLIATENKKEVSAWLKNTSQISMLSPKEKEEECLLMGLRLIQEGYPITNISNDKIKKALKNKWITLKDNKIFTTQKGRIMLNQLILLLS